MPVTGRKTALPGVGRTFVGGFESTYLPGADVDLLETTGHTARWRQDLDRMLDAGVRHLRYPLRWHRIEPEPGRYDRTGADAVLGHLRSAGAVPIVDLVHHTSYPAWLTGGFRDPGFTPAYLRFAEAVATRYPWLPAYTLFNEPFAACRQVVSDGLAERDRRLEPVRARQEWDAIAAAMAALLDRAGTRTGLDEQEVAG